VSEPRLVLCSGAEKSNLPKGRSRLELRLDAIGPRANLNLCLENVSRVVARQLADRQVDLLEIAAYVYAADSAVARGAGWSNGRSKEAWERDFHFVIPVRDLDFWSRNDVIGTLVQLLRFLADDNFSFEFQSLAKTRNIQEYLDVGPDEEWPFYDLERVIMFSGGLDSLAGTIEQASQGRKIALVSHRPVSTQNRRTKELFRLLDNRFQGQLVHIPVWVNKAGKLSSEYTQRTRSFLFATLGTAVAESLRASGVRFFENGVVSLNFPVADEVVRARASRTTHPVALDLIERLLTMVLERPFKVDNPFILRTKGEVVRSIADHGHADLISQTRSCAHGMFVSTSQWHCGTCSQCIDRRVAIMSEELEEWDNDHDYETSVFTGERKSGYEQNMAINYARHAIEMNRLSESGLEERFNLDLSRAIRPFSNRVDVARQFISMHQRHAVAVTTVLRKQIGEHSQELISGELPESSMLSLVAGQKHKCPSWQGYVDKILDILERGLPISCETHKPKDEKHLQQVCDGLLQTQDADLIREFPFMVWSSVMTKPDWSNNAHNLLIELKYVRAKNDVMPITKDIAEDITKYGDSGARVLYVIYDPTHVIVNKEAFCKPIRARPSMRIYIIN
jgi:7-cyano-7-deazaguanine synthase in queuosine biosynthesis